MTRRAASRNETRNRIVEATAKLHGERGVLGTTWQDIAREADVSVSTVYRAIESGLRGLTSGYRTLLRGALKVRPLILLIGLSVAGSSYFLFSELKSELAPTEDQGLLVGIIQAPEGSTIEYTDSYAKKLEGIFAKRCQ